MEYIKRAEKDNVRLSIYQDSDPTNPRKEAFDTFGTMVCWHRRYTLGDEHSYSSADNFIRSFAEDNITYDERYKFDKDGEEIDILDEMNEKDLFNLATKNMLILSLNLYDHSGITMSVNNFGDPWDSGQVGWIYVKNKNIQHEFGSLDDGAIKKAKNILIDEVKIYDQYLTGEVYGFVLEKKNICECCKHVEWEEIDSCWGFFGEDIFKNGLKGEISKEYEYLIDILEDR